MRTLLFGAAMLALGISYAHGRDRAVESRAAVLEEAEQEASRVADALECRLGIGPCVLMVSPAPRGP